MIIPSITAKARRHEIDNLKTRWADFEKGYAIYNALPHSEQEQALWKQFPTDLEAWKTEHAKLVDLASKVILDDVAALEANIVSRHLDHVKWVAEMDKDIAAGTLFTGTLDPNASYNFV